MQGHEKYTTAELVVKQFELETKMITEGTDKYKQLLIQAEEGGRSADNAYALKLTNQLLEPSVNLLNQVIARGKTKHYDVFTKVTPETAVMVGLKTLFNSLYILRKDSIPTMTSLSVAIGEAIQLELKLMHLEKVDEQYMKEVMRDWRAKKATSLRHKLRVTSNLYSKKDIKWDTWDTDVKAKIGRVILETLLRQNTVIRKVTKINRNKRQVHISFTEELLDWVQRFVEHNSTLHPRLRPMIVAPNDWSATTRPYLANSTNTTLDFVRTRNKQARKFYKSINPEMYSAVNKAQSTAWRINSKILDFARELQQLQNPVIIPKVLSDSKPAYPFPNKKKEELTEQELSVLKDWKASVRDIYTADVQNRSNRQRLNMTLSIASDYRDYDRIYFPHSIDTRGRIYAIPTVLQPQGDDLCKSVLEFATGYKLTSEGVHQLKIQIASKYGLDKASHVDRLDWFKDNEKYLLALAENPLDYLDFLGEVDKPFQFLSAVFDYHKWYNDKDAMIHARVNKDGACNGLQHFAMMLGDKELGKSVNLLESNASDEPNSIYKVVAKEVQDLLANDNSKESRIWRSFWLEYNEGKVDYKCMKRPVMTLPYSATSFSRRSYIRDYVVEKGAKDWFGNNLGDCLTYMTHVVTKAMQTRIPSACASLKWLSELCSEVLKDNSNVQWTTPLGFTVFNQKNKYSSKKIRVRFLSSVYDLRIRSDVDKVDIGKVRSSIAPNFVHSLDACHMLMIVNKCHSLGVTDLHLVHDDYGCHANFGGVLTEIAKEEFYRLYTEYTPIKDLWNRYELELPLLEEINTLNRGDVLLSNYAFD